MPVNSQNRSETRPWACALTGAVRVIRHREQGACFGGVSRACRQRPRQGSGWVDAERWFTYMTRDLEAGSFQLSHETCSITDCQRKEQTVRHTQ